MARRRKRRRRSSRRIWIFGAVISIAGVWTYGHFISPFLEGEPEPQRTVADGHGASDAAVPVRPRLTSSRPRLEVPTATDVSEKGSDNATAAVTRAETPTPEAARLLAAGMKALNGGDVLTARARLSDATQAGLTPQQMIDARAALVRIANETIFSQNVYENDPLVRRYTISPGETLGQIAKKFDVTDDLLATINNLGNKNLIRAGQTIKVLRGPFNIRIDKPTYGMDVYLQNTLVKHYPVGLGEGGSTPTGSWKVANKLKNPTYYPPRGGAIVAANDPQNPLGEYWIGLAGVSGNAVGAMRYGIHGTIDPDSIGRSVSMGCVRMHNADVAEVYSLLIPEKSQVVIE